MTTLYDIQVSERMSDNVPRLRTYLVSGSRRRVFQVVRELENHRPRRLCRVIDFYGHILSTKEIADLDK